MKKLHNLTKLLMLALLASATIAFAQMGEMKHDQGMKMDKKAEQHESHGSGMETPRWKQSMTEQQKMKADKMHLELKKSMSVLEAKVKMKEVELNSIVMRDKPDANDIHLKVNEITELNKEMMIKKYDHIVEMRSILTPEQRVSFDLGLVGMHH